MFGLGLLTKAINALTANLTALATTLAEINSGLRGRLQLDHADEPDQLPHRIEADAEVPAARKGRAKTATTTE
jgi:hypothetical protein